MTKVVNRLDVWEEEPLYWDHLAAIDKRLYASTIPRRLIELIKVRVSQINKCVFCIDYHTSDALKAGETQRRLFVLSAWKESPLFTDKEKSALQAAEEITHISVDGLTDKTYEQLKAHYNTREIADLFMVISHINFLNRIGISTGTVAL
jgi:AhpD family alkylhydroperoxidase